MSKQRTAVEELDPLTDEIIRELDGIAVRRRVIETLDPKDQRIVIGMLEPFRDLLRGSREQIDRMLARTLDEKLADEDDR